MENLAQNHMNEYRYFINEYIKISNFNDLYNKFLTISYADRYMLLAFAACVEGDINIDLKTKSWSVCNAKKYVVLNNNVEASYIFINICNYIKSNERYYNFIITYFNLWHGNESPYFSYDKYHKNDLENNLIQLIDVIKEDTDKLKNNEDKKFAEKYLEKCNALMDFIFT
jgi:hypothetical protein